MLNHREGLGGDIIESARAKDSTQRDRETALSGKAVLKNVQNVIFYPCAGPKITQKENMTKHRSFRSATVTVYGAQVSLF